MLRSKRRTSNVQARKPFRKSKALQQFAGRVVVSGREKFTMRQPARLDSNKRRRRCAVLSSILRDLRKSRDGIAAQPRTRFSPD
jgi:hypothetical protein